MKSFKKNFPGYSNAAIEALLSQSSPVAQVDHHKRVVTAFTRAMKRLTLHPREGLAVTGTASLSLPGCSVRAISVAFDADDFSTVEKSAGDQIVTVTTTSKASVSRVLPGFSDNTITMEQGFGMGDVRLQTLRQSYLPVLQRAFGGNGDKATVSRVKLRYRLGAFVPALVCCVIISFLMFSLLILSRDPGRRRLAQGRLHPKDQGGLFLLR